MTRNNIYTKNAKQYILVWMFFIFNPIPIFSQENLKDSTDNYITFLVPDELPDYPGGFSKMNEFINKNLIKPLNYTVGKVYINVIIEKNGQLKNPSVVKGINAACDEAALEVVRKMPKFKSAKKLGTV